jgi:hypothetical protein
MRRPAFKEAIMPALISRRAVAGICSAVLARTSLPSWAQGSPKIVVTKDPTCSCCAGWVDHLRGSGFAAEVIENPEINRVKVRLGVPQDLASCHTAEIDGYVVEGHVPAQAIRRLLAERPQARGLAVPGMPVGSPGMEVAGTEPETYEVILFGPSGQRPFARFRGAVET